MEILHGKILTLFLFLIAVLLSTLSPVYFSRCGTRSSGLKGKIQIFMAFGNSFAGGVFLSTCFAGLLPFVRESYSKALSILKDEHNYPLTELTVLTGFLLIVVIEHGFVKKYDECRKKSRKNDKSQENENLISDSEGGSEHREHECQGHDAGHSHSLELSSNSLLRSVVLVITLGIHSLFEGMAIGLITSTDMLVTLSVAVLIHEICCSIALGINISQQRIDKCTAFTVCIVFSAMMPFGIGVGIGLGEIQGLTGLMLTAVLQGIATGTFMYVLFLEIIPSVFAAQSSYKHMLLMLVGCIVMSVIILFTHNHKHENVVSAISNYTSAANLQTSTFPHMH